MAKIEIPAELRGTPEQQIKQLRTYLFRLAEMLNVTLDAIEAKADQPVIQESQGGGKDGKDGKDGRDGRDGTSVTVKSVSESTEDGGSNVVTFSDNNTITIRNGSRGSTGTAGADGYTPVKGVDYFDGADGYTPIKGVDYFDGVSGKDGSPGKDGYSPVKGVDYFDGKDGYTPVKGVDYFDGKDGKDGTSVTVKSVSENAADGGSNVVTFSDGNTVTIRNGNRGSAGADGKDGYTPVKGIDYFDGKAGADGYTPVKNIDYFDGKDGQAGRDGTSVTVKSVSESTADGGNNIVTFSDGKSVTIKNGSRGSDGAAGAAGYTPVKNVDYFDGKDGRDGTSVTVQSVSESSADSGSNVVTFSDGKTITIKNGSKGSTGSTGPAGPTGASGADGQPGKDGKSAYDSAKAGGYTGTEAEFYTALAQSSRTGPIYPMSV